MSASLRSVAFVGHTSFGDDLRPLSYIALYINNIDAYRTGRCGGAAEKFLGNSLLSQLWCINTWISNDYYVSITGSA